MKYSPILTVSLLALLLGCISCKKNDNSRRVAVNVHDSLVFEALSGIEDHICFSTFDASFTQPLDRYKITPDQHKNVDILFFYDWEYGNPGFLDPYTSAQSWHWDNQYYYYHWMAGASQTLFYKTNFTEKEFVKAKSEGSLIDNYFKNVSIAPHGVFPEGTCIGGRSYNELKKGQVWGLKNVRSGKRSLMFIRFDQDLGWPKTPVYRFATKVDIISEK